jgi:hypothetical protein
MDKKEKTKTTRDDIFFTREDLVNALKEDPGSVYIVAPGNLRETAIYHDGEEEIIEAKQKTKSKKNVKKAKKPKSK